MAEETVIDPKEHRAKPEPEYDTTEHYKRGIVAQRKRQEKDLTTALARYNVKPIVVGEGNRQRIDFEKSIEALVVAGAPDIASKLEEKYASRIAEGNQALETANQRYRRLQIDTLIKDALRDFHPEQLNDAFVLFRNQYTVELEDDTNSVIILDRNGEPLRDETTMAPLSLERACELFFESRPGLQRKQERSPLEGLGNMRGGGRGVLTNDALGDAYIRAVEEGDDAKAKSLQAEMSQRAMGNRKR